MNPNPVNNNAHCKTSPFTKLVLSACLFLLLLLIVPCVAYSQSEGYDEVSITLNVERIGSTEITALIHDQVSYLPIKELFDFLKIKNRLSEHFDTLSGFFINPNAIFHIDKASNVITYQDKTYELATGDLLRTESNLYLKANYFGEIFGLNCSFNFRSLSIVLDTKIELPAIRERQLELMRRNISLLKGEKKADTTIGRSSRRFSFGMADWSLTSTQQFKTSPITRLYLGLGAVIAGGEATASVNYTSNAPFSAQQLLYRWKYVNNNARLLKQITAGKIFAQSIATVYAPIAGIQLTNTPTTFKKSFGTYTLSNTTKPDWTVELYVNNVLVNYTKADASGFFTFEVPMIYGNSLVKLKFYGPWGEEETREQNLNIPFNFIPVRQFEYSITSGLVEDGTKGFFSRANLNYGITKRLTAGGGLEYLSSLTTGKLMPFANASFRLGPSFLISGEHTVGVRTKGNINYRLPSNLQFDFNYTRFEREQTAIRYNFLEEKRAIISMPIRAKKFSGFGRLTVDQYTLLHEKNTPVTRNRSAELLLSAVVKGVSTNVTTNAIINDGSRLSTYTNLSLTFRMPSRILFTPQIQYDYTSKAFTVLRSEIQKPVFKKGYFNCSFAKDVVKGTLTMGIGLRYNFSFAQTSLSMMQRKGATSVTQFARGSLVYDDETRKLQLDDQYNVGRGSLIIIPFVDINCNGVRDANEPKAFGLDLRINGGYMERNIKDTTITVLGLEAYNNYFIELDKNSFDNISWQIKKSTINVAIEPNRFKLVEVPVSVIGEASGTVFIKDEKGKKGLGRIVVNITDSKGSIVTKLLTEADGYFNFMGLRPGTYTATIDKVQLTKINMSSSPPKMFTIKAGVDGDVAEGLDFILNSN